MTFGSPSCHEFSPSARAQTLPSLIYTLTQIPGGDAGALRLTLISIAISMLALMAAEFLARRLARILPSR
jgi:molybdate transport system permease protein